MQFIFVFSIVLFSISLNMLNDTKPLAAEREDIPVVRNFDLNQYLGVWYEIARLPHRFEKNLDQVTATYTLMENGKIKVINRGFNVVKGKWKQATGKAWVPDPARRHI